MQISFSFRHVDSSEGIKKYASNSLTNIQYVTGGDRGDDLQAATNVAARTRGQLLTKLAATRCQ